MKIGLLAYSTNTGLGIQTYDFYKHIKPSRVMVADLSKLNKVETHHERYPDAMVTDGFPSKKEIDKFLDGLDLVFVCETPLNYYLFERARELGVKTVLQFNYEFLDYLQRDLPKPDLFLSPSTWHIEEMKEKFPTKMLRVPVDRNKFKRQNITKIRNLLHIAGRPAVHDRNGTLDTLEAFNKAKPPETTLTVKIQDKEKAKEYKEKYKDQIIIDDSDVMDNADLYKGYDALVLPRKYGGLCLPVNEALSCGMPIIMTDVSPNNEWLPMEWLVQSIKVGSFTARSEIDIHQAHPLILEKRIREFIYSDWEKLDVIEKGQKVKKNKAEYWSDVADSVADTISWEKMKEEYIKTFEELLNESSNNMPSN